MRKPDTQFSCHSCGKIADGPPGATPCEAPGVVEHYNFCSFSYLEAWANAKVPKVPEVFLDSFGEDKTK